MHSLQLDVKGVKTYIGIEAPYTTPPTKLLIQLNYLEDQMGWSASGHTSADVYSILKQQGLFVTFEDHCGYYDPKTEQSTPPIWTDLQGFEFLVENSPDPQLFVPFGTYIYQHQQELLTELSEGMSFDDWCNKEGFN